MSLATLHNLVANLGAAAQIARQLRSSESLRSAPDDHMRVADLLMAIAEARSEATTLLLSSVPATAHSAPSPVTPTSPPITLQALLDEYVRVKKARLKPDTIRRYRDCLDRYWASYLSLPAESLTPDVFRAHFITLPSPAQANHSLRIIRALFNFYNAAHDTNLLNPVQKVLKLEGAFVVRPRDRLIADEDQARWYASVQQGSRTSAELFLTLALTGLRLGEGLRLSWECVDFEKNSLTIPETKNGKPLLIPMGYRLKMLLSKRKADLRRDTWQAGSLASAADHVLNRMGSDRDVTRFAAAEEERPARGFRALMLQIVSQSLPGSHRQRQGVLPS